MQKDTRKTYKPNKTIDAMIDKILIVRGKEFTGVSDVINRAVEVLYKEMGVESDYFAMVDQGHAQQECST